MKQITIRQYNPSDKDTVWQLHELGHRQMNTWVESPDLDSDLHVIEETYLTNHGEFLVAEIAGRVVGMGALRKEDNTTAVVKRMRVHPDFQGKGIGSRLLDALIKRAPKLGYTRLTLDTLPSMKSAHRLYESRGFREFRREKTAKSEIIFYEKGL